MSLECLDKEAVSHYQPLVASSNWARQKLHMSLCCRWMDQWQCLPICAVRIKRKPTFSSSHSQIRLYLSSLLSPKFMVSHSARVLGLPNSLLSRHAQSNCRVRFTLTHLGLWMRSASHSVDKWGLAPPVDSPTMPHYCPKSLPP